MRKKASGDRWFVYMVKCADSSLYTGIAKDMDRRCQQHNAGTASRYTRFEAGEKHFVGTDLQGVNLGHADLQGIDLHGADLTGATLAQALLAGADLRGATLAGSNLHGADLSEARLGWADFSEADLQGVILPPAILGADLQGADLTEATLPDDRSDN